jgi:isopentenyl diphosphate isomerase/L-lactate dehydrogenase-like FMN-dependent dehydrogenase
VGRLQWILDAWQGPIVVKGVHTADDARQSIDHGAAAVVVSNHGGRQLDGVAPTLRVLPEVLAAVNDLAEVLLDGGIRRGSDIVKALCLGARAVLIGRAYAYGLGAAGGAGVARSIDILRSDIIRTMKLLGCASVRDLDQSFIDIPTARPSDRSGPLTLDEIDRLRVHGRSPLPQEIIDLARRRER